MATLLERLQQRLAAPVAAPEGQTEFVKQSLAAGKGRAATAPRLQESTIGDQAATGMAQQAANQQTAQAQTAAQAVGEEAAGVTAAADTKRAELASQRRVATAGLGAEGRVKRGELATTRDLATQQRDAQTFTRLAELSQRSDQALAKLTTDRGISEDQMFGKFAREMAGLDDDRYKSELDQALFVAALSNKKYLQELAQTGDLRRLENSANFQKELRDEVYGKELAGLLYHYGTLEQVDAQGRGWDNALTRLDQEGRWQVYKAAAANAKKRMMWYGVSSSAAQVGESYYDESQKSDSKESK